jgi:hypothetical protein
MRCLVVDFGFVGDHVRLDLGGWEIECERDEALTGRLLEVLQDALVAGVVGNHQLEPGRRRQRRAEPIDRKLTAVIGEWVDDHRGVLARLHYLVQVEDGASAHGPRQGPVNPDRFPALEKEAAHQIRRRHVFVARNGDEVATELVGHRLYEACLSTSCGPLQQYWQPTPSRRPKDRHLIADCPVKRCLRSRLNNGGMTVGQRLSSLVRRGRSSGALRHPGALAHRRC